MKNCKLARNFELKIWTGVFERLKIFIYTGWLWAQEHVLRLPTEACNLYSRGNSAGDNAHLLYDLFLKYLLCGQIRNRVMMIQT